MIRGRDHEQGGEVIVIDIDAAALDANRELVKEAQASWEDIDRGLVILLAGLGVTFDPVVVDDNLTVRVDCPSRRNASSCVSFVIGGSSFSASCAPAWALLKAVAPFKESVDSFNEQIRQSRSDAEAAVDTLKSLRGEIGIPKPSPKKRTPKPPPVWPAKVSVRTPISKLGFSTRARRLLRWLDVKTVGDLQKHTEKEIKELKGFGPSCWAEVAGFLERYHRRLAKEEKKSE